MEDARQSTLDRMALRDSFVNLFVKGMMIYQPMGQAVRVSHVEYPVRPFIPTETEELQADEIAALMMNEVSEESRCPVIIGHEMPDFLGPQGIVVSTGGNLCMTAMAQAFSCIETWNAVVSAVVIPSPRLADMRCWGNNDPFKDGSTKDAESRGVFGRIWTADVYVRNHLFETRTEGGCSWLLACPDSRYPRGLCGRVEV